MMPRVGCVPRSASASAPRVVLSRGYHLRWEVRDNIVGVEEVTGAVTTVGTVPPHETNFEHVWSVLIGLDVILERQKGRRY